jgi:hypothetical protein
LADEARRSGNQEHTSTSELVSKLLPSIWRRKLARAKGRP